MKQLKKKLWFITPYFINIVALDFGYGGNYGVSIIEILTRKQEERGLESSSLFSIALQRIYENNRFKLYLWNISVLFINSYMMKKLN